MKELHPRHLQPTKGLPVPPPQAHPLRELSFVPSKTAGPAAPSWPVYTGKSQFVGTSTDGRTNVWVDPSLGAGGLTNAQALVADASRINALNDTIFGTPGGSTNVMVYALGGATDGTGGALHASCDYQTGGDIECCVALGSPDRLGALYMAELSECSMGGQLCGASTGEGLSRWCAAVSSNNALGDFSTFPTWVQDGKANWVDQTQQTDQNADSTGCAMGFLSWLMGAKGIALTQIAPEMVNLTATGTLAQLATNLTGMASGTVWGTFLAAVNALPASSLNTDDPFNGFANAVPGGTPAPGPTPGPTPGPVPTPSPSQFCTVYSAVRPLILFIESLPFIPAAEQAIIAGWVATLDAFCPQPAAAKAMKFEAFKALDRAGQLGYLCGIYKAALPYLPLIESLPFFPAQLLPIVKQLVKVLSWLCP